MSLFGGTAQPGGKVVLVGASDEMLVSDDDGVHFRQVSGGGRRNYTAVLPAGNGEWLTAGDEGIHLKQPTAAAAPTTAAAPASGGTPGDAK
jgi:hypothetical protein